MGNLEALNDRKKFKQNERKMDTSSWGFVSRIFPRPIRRLGFAKLYREHYEDGWSPSSLLNGVLVSLSGSLAGSVVTEP